MGGGGYEKEHCVAEGGDEKTCSKNNPGKHISHVFIYVNICTVHMLFYVLYSVKFEGSTIS